MAQLKATTYRGLSDLVGPPDVNEKIGVPVKIGHNTTAERTGSALPSILVRLHGHPIVRLWASGRVDWTLAGYGTVTTRERVNQFLPPHRGVGQTDHVQVWRAWGGEGVRENLTETPIDPRAWYDQDGQEVSR